MPLTKPKSDEAIWAIAQRGVATAAVFDVVAPKVRERMAHLTAEAIRGFNNLERRYTPEEALLFVAALAANQFLLDALDRDIDDGQKAGQHFVR